MFILPWAVPALPTFLSIHWMLNGDWGLIDNLIWLVFHVNGAVLARPSRWTALSADIIAYVWKWLPFWTVILLAGRMAIPQELYEAADVDGATGLRRFRHVTFPLLANLYLVCTLLGMLFTLGDFSTVYFVSGGGPANTTQVLATLGVRDAYRLVRAASGRCGGDVGHAGAGAVGLLADAASARRGGGSMSATTIGAGRPNRRPPYRAAAHLGRSRVRYSSASCWRSGRSARSTT